MHHKKTDGRMLLRSQTGSVAPPHGRCHTHYSPQNASRLGVSDDVEAYLHAFEATATQEDWPRTQCVGLLAPFLSGDAPKAYQDVEAHIDSDSGLLKGEILSCHGLSKISIAQRFHEWTRTRQEQLNRNYRKPGHRPVSKGPPV